MLNLLIKSRKQICSFQCFSQYRCFDGKINETDSIDAAFSSADHGDGSFDATSSSAEHETDSIDARETRSWRRYFEKIRADADIVMEVLKQDGPGFDLQSELDNLHIRASGNLLREVFLRFLKIINPVNKVRIAKTAYKFFSWSRQQPDYVQTSCSYNLLMKIFAEAEELKALWKTLDEMTEKGFPVTALTFNILICTCGEIGLAKKLVERFIKSKTFNYRPFKNSYNAILHSLIILNQFVLIEWVYEQMVVDGKSPDVLTYNILLRAKYGLGKSEEFYNLLDGMNSEGLFPDFHTYTILLHVLGRKNKPLAALNLLNHMREVGIDPTTLHFTTLVDGLSRACNLEACKYFFEEMIKHGCIPDVVCYTVMITGYVVAGDMEKALVFFREMIIKGKMPNVFTYGSLIRGFCIAGRFQDAFLMLKEMERKGCAPNFVVYSTLFKYLISAGKSSEAHHILRQISEKGRYVNMVSKLRQYMRN